MKKILSKYLDEKLVNMPKMGFDIPLLNWIKNSKKLRDIIKGFYFADNGKINELMPRKKFQTF